MSEQDLTGLTADELIELELKLRSELAKRKEAKRYPIRTKIYLHNDKESNFDKGRELELSDKQLEEFVYTGYEVEVETEVDEDGKAYAVAFQGIRLPGRVRF